MKRYLILFVVLMGFACTKNQDPAPVNQNPNTLPQPASPSSKILMLKVDYLTYTFEGGKELNLSQATLTSDSIPVKVNYHSPGDFGDITLSYKHTGDSLFHGGIIWMGKGSMTFPSQLDSAATFAHINQTISQPAATRFQAIFHHPGTPNITSLWNAVNKLKVVKDYLYFNKKIGLFCYTPSVGIGDPADWDWFIFLSN